MKTPEPLVGAPPPRLPLKSAQAIAAAAEKRGRPIPAAVRAAFDAAEPSKPGAPAKPAKPAAGDTAGPKE